MDDMYKLGQGATTCPSARWINLGTGCAGLPIFTHTVMGLGYGLLQHDMVDRFLLHYFTQSAHGSARGTFITPESVTITDRTHVVSYSASGINNAPLCLKWMLVFEEPETKTLWLGKAVPRAWLALGEDPINVQNATTRYGRITFSMQAATAAAAAVGELEGIDGGAAPQAAPSYTIKISVTVPASWATAANKPAGGLTVRVRAPTGHAGKMSSVSVGGKPWGGFDAATETVSFTSADLDGPTLTAGLQTIVVMFSASAAAPLRRARVPTGHMGAP